jgi:hypothetical protein
MKNNQTGETNLCYCPDSAETKKSGRPKTNKKKKSFLKENKNKKSKKRSDSR